MSAKQYTPEWVEENVGSVENLIHQRFPRVPESYDYVEKNNVRDHMVAQAKKWLIDSSGKRIRHPIRLLFLPHVCAIDLYQFSQSFGVNAQESLAVEHNASYAKFLRAWVEAAKKLPGWKLFRGLRIFEGKISQATSQFDGEFDIVNLDFNGPWNKEVIATLTNLFQRELLAIPSIIFITLNDTEVWRNSRRGSKSRSLKETLPGRVYRLTNGTRYTCHRLFYMDWIGEGESKMVMYAFGVHEKEKRP